MKQYRKALFILAVLPFFGWANTAASGNLDGLLGDMQGDFKQGRQRNDAISAERKRKAAEKEAARSARDRSRDFCYALPAGSDAQIACLGDYPNAIRDDRARNIMLGYCYSLGSNSDFTQDLSYICSEGPRGCSLLDNGKAAYWCSECGGTRSWLAVYSLGHIIQCRK